MARDPELPESLLYAIGAGIGGSGLDAVAKESLAAAVAGGFLGRAVALSCRPGAVPADKVQTLRWNPVRLLNVLKRPYAIGAKKQALDRAAARLLRTGNYDFFHGWSGDCLETLRLASARGIPSLLEIPTWHRNKGKQKPDITTSERKRDAAAFPQSVFNRMLISRQRVMEEYRLATLILVLSEKARETFLAAGFPEEKLFRMHRGVDPSKFLPTERLPEKFRAIFVGAIGKRKGIPTLIEAWNRAALPDAELVLVGAAQPEVEAILRDAPPNVILKGHVANVADELRQATIHVFPSELEGSAKATYEAAACGLPQIATRESGDIVIDGFNGWIVPPNDPDRLSASLRLAYSSREQLAEMGASARKRILENFTWDHFRARLLEAYRAAKRLAAKRA